jgi:hypothetical protein
MRLTDRCLDILKLLHAARWLSTGQLRRRFFPQATADAVRKRLRKLTQARYLLMVQEHRMSEALFTLGPEGKRTLERAGGRGITLERTPPKQLDHFLGINDLRIAAELAEDLSYFFACWELPGLGWAHPIIPDAVFSLRNRTHAVEFDRGVEGVRFFVQTKIAAYKQGFDDLALRAVLVVADRRSRMDSLAKAIGDGSGRFLFTTLDRVRTDGLLAPIFYLVPGTEGVTLV